MEWIWYLVAFGMGIVASALIPKDYTVKTCIQCGGTGVDYYTADLTDIKRGSMPIQCEKCKGTGKVINK